MSDGTINTAFRTTVTGALLELGGRPEVIDRQLAHRERKEVFGAYSHQAEYLAERRKMMQQWADCLDQVGRGMSSRCMGTPLQTSASYSKFIRRETQ